VKPDNMPAIRLYESCGMGPVARSTAMRIAWADVARLPEATIALEPARSSPESDARWEAAFGFAQGQMAAFRTSTERIFIELAPPDEAPGALAAFDPGFPGAMPFRVAHPTYARALLDAMRTHARPEFDYVRFIADHRDDLADRAHAAGAVALLEILRMEGEIPAPAAVL
jgi:hypothetical protein